MSSRMEKYDDVSLEGLSRTKRNQNIYNMTDLSELSRIKTDNNVSVISDAQKEIDLEKIKNYVYSLDNEDEKRKKILLQIPEEQKEEPITRIEIKDYDINAVLERAKDKRSSDYEQERYRKVNNTSIDILKNIKIREEKLKREVDLDLTSPIDELNTEEKTIVDLINDIQSHGKSKSSNKNLFEDLMGDNDDTIVAPMNLEEESKGDLKEELLNMTRELDQIKMPENEFTREINIEKEQLKEKRKNEDSDEEAPKIKEVDKSFYSNSMTFNKSDFDGFEDLENGVKKSGILTKLAIFFIIIMLLGTIFLILNYVFEWNII